MIKKVENEYREGDLAIKTINVYLFCIPIFKHLIQTTNNDIVRNLTVQHKSNKIKGFNYETKD